MILDIDFSKLVKVLSKNIPSEKSEFDCDTEYILSIYEELMTNISWMLNNYHEQYLDKNVLKKLLEIVNTEYESEIWNKGLEYVSHNNNETYFDLLSYVRADIVDISSYEIELIEGTSNVLKICKDNGTFFFKEDISLNTMISSFEKSFQKLKNKSSYLYDVCKRLFLGEERFKANLENKKYRWGKNRDKDVELIKSFAEKLNLKIDEEWYDDIILLFSNWFAILRSYSISFDSAKIEKNRFLSLRNVAFYRFAFLLDEQQLVAKSKRCILFTDDGIKVGVMLNKARGVDFKSLNIPKNTQFLECIRISPKAQAQLIKLQMLDSIAGQVDRHVNNYFVDVSKDEDSKYLINSVQAIDNDFSFGVFSFSSLPDKVKRKITLPRLTDKKNRLLTGLLDLHLCEKILKLKESLLRYVLGDILCDDEFDALEKRIEEMCSVIKNEKSSGRIVDESKWGEKTEKFLLNDASQNYVKRLLTYKKGNRYAWKNVENKLK